MINPTSWLEVDLDKISENVKNIKKYLGSTRLLAVVKANAYGHGLYPVASCAVESGADFLGVSSIEEGIFLRKKGISQPLLVFNTILPEQAADVLDYGLTATVCSLDVVQALNEVAARQNKKATIHVKIDTGFGRFGALPDHAAEMIRLIISNFDNIYLEGIYTHFSKANNEKITYKQFNAFMSLVETLNEQDIEIPIKHVCNSVAALNYPEMHLDMVRVGNLIYGMVPSKEIAITNPSKICSRVIFLKNLPKGHYIGYGNKYKTKKPTTIAVVPFGYFDGLEVYVFQPNGFLDGLKYLIKQVLFRFGIYSSSRKANINGASCYILGKISMQNCIVDVTKIKNNVFVGDVVELSARRLNLSQSIVRIYHRAGRVFSENDITPAETASDFAPPAGQRRETSIG
ncbi:MAG TPA: alanine racemase [Tepidanaerobacteraceae bacterium]|nr:alanine racemase [Tepidanaerobacteraceae bacterium]